mgnify:CR=1 FL=1
MDALFIALSLVLILLGVAGSFLPVLPGPPIAFVGILIFHFFVHALNADFLWMSGLAMVVITVADYLLPGFLVKKGKGSPWAVRGANLGMLIGLFGGPAGIILGPFIGAWVGEMIAGSAPEAALRPAFFAFLGFLCGVGLKLAYGVYLLIKILLEVF